MIKIEKVKSYGWEEAIRGMRNPLNSWDKSDSRKLDSKGYLVGEIVVDDYVIGNNDKTLMMKLRNAGTDHRKFMRMICVYADITAPLYYFKELDTYKVGTVANSCSTMHKIHAKEFTIDDFSHEHLLDDGYITHGGDCYLSSMNCLKEQIHTLNMFREKYLETKDKTWWWQMIQLLPSSYNQKRTIMLNYEVLANIYKSRKNHKLDEWRDFCKWIEALPFNELITGGINVQKEED